jgi:hypothetical protein
MSWARNEVKKLGTRVEKIKNLKGYFSVQQRLKTWGIRNKISVFEKCPTIATAANVILAQ